jgi:acyl-ACP thioesterase
LGARQVRLGDVDPRGELRLDAIARFLQDVASDDTNDSGLGGTFAWVVRRTMIEVLTPAVLDERLEFTTWSAGAGRAWAERRTSLSGAAGASIEAVCLWVRIDPVSGRPSALDPAFHELYGEANQGRSVSSRLSLPGPAPEAERRPWTVRAVDLDLLGHVNNAVHWAVLEELLATSGRARVGRGEVEYRMSLDAGLSVELAVNVDPAQIHGWLVSAGTTITAARWTGRAATPA